MTILLTGATGYIGSYVANELLNRTDSRIAVLVPCYNEAVTVAKVVEDFRAALPQAEICVFDNNSRDDTGGIALRHGARVQTVNLQGKGHVVRRLFADVEADVVGLE